MALGKFTVGALCPIFFPLSFNPLSFCRNPNLTGISNDPMRAHALVTHGSIEILVLYDA